MLPLLCASPTRQDSPRAASSSSPTRCGEGVGRDGLTASGPGGLAALGALNFATHVFFLGLFVAFDGSLKDRRSSTNPSVILGCDEIQVTIRRSRPSRKGRFGVEKHF